MVLGKLTWLGIALAVIAWGIDATMHALVLHEGSLVTELYAVPPAIMAMRAAIASLLVILGGYAQHTVAKRKRMEEALRESEANFRTLVETTAAASFIFRGTRICYANSSAEALTGYTREELLAVNFWDVIHPDFRELVKERGLARQRGERVPANYEVKILTKSGDERWVDFTARPIEFEGKQAVLGTAFDMTDRKQAEGALRKRTYDLGERVKELNCLYGISHLLEQPDRSLEEILQGIADLIPPGWQYPEITCGRVILEGEEFRTENFKETKWKQASEIIVDGKRVGTVEVYYLEERPEIDEGPFLKEERSLIAAIAERVVRITERKRAEEALREQVRRDPLTGALNHGTIVEELRNLISSRDGGAPFAVAMVDVDGLKAINDTYGHQVGDAVLVAVARELPRDGALVGRYGGDEFVVVLPGADPAAAERYRDSVLDELAHIGLTDPETGASVPVAASLGLAIYPEEADTIADLIRLADSAMYASRRQRVVGAGGLSPSRPLGGDRATAMVGEITPLLASPGELKDKLRLVADRLSIGTGYDGVNFMLYASALRGAPLAGTRFVQVPHERAEQWMHEYRKLADDPLRQTLERTQRPIILQDPQHDQRFTDGERELVRTAGVRTVLIVPMIWQHKLIGSLSVVSKREAAFGPRDAQFVVAVATQVTAIVRMATLVEELESTSARLAQAQTETVMLLAAVAEAHDHTTGLHLQGVRTLTEALACELGHSEEDVKELGLAAVLHDIGKIRVPDSILTSTGKLANEEWELMKQHTTWGGELLAGRPDFELAAAIARSHHERWDGSGYPDGLSGEAIPEAATIVAVADSFDAMTHDRPYKKRWSVAQTVREIAACSGTQFSPKVVAALERLAQRNALPLAPTSARDQRAAA